MICFGVTLFIDVMLAFMRYTRRYATDAAHVGPLIYAASLMSPTQRIFRHISVMPEGARCLRRFRHAIIMVAVAFFRRYATSGWPRRHAWYAFLRRERF